MLDPRELEGRTYGPFRFRTCLETVRRYVEATSDNTDAWTEWAPPSIAGAALFAVAPQLLAEVASGTVIHGDQSFAWHAPIPIEGDLAVEGSVSRVRERSGVSFLGFDMSVSHGDGLLVEGSSTFLMSGAADSRNEIGEPEPDDRAVCDPLDALEVGSRIGPLRRSASRADLIRYAGASGDWNPVHWDHHTGVAAGFGGIVVHGLLQSAWICGVACRLGSGPAPLVTAKFRYRNPLRPAAQAEIVGTRSDETTLKLDLLSGDSEVVSSVVRLRP